MAISDTPGRGRKHCPSCNKYVGVRSRNCPNCQFAFVSGATAPTKPPTKKFLNPPTTPKISVPEKPVETKSHVDRVNYLRDELIRELNRLSKSYGRGIVDQIWDAIKD